MAYSRISLGMAGIEGAAAACGYRLSVSSMASAEIETSELAAGKLSLGF
jgi:hypothetical protein